MEQFENHSKTYREVISELASEIVSEKHSVKTLSTLELGCYGEAVASEYLCRNGYQIVARNVKNKRGEIDILAAKLPGDNKSISVKEAMAMAVGQEPILTAVEVKTRRSLTYGFAREAVNHLKQMHIRQTLLWYLASHPQWSGYRIRFDVIEVYIAPNGEATVKHWPGCFE